MRKTAEDFDALVRQIDAALAEARRLKVAPVVVALRGAHVLATEAQAKRSRAAAAPSAS